MMFKLSLFIYSLIGFICTDSQEKNPKLYNLPGIATPVEFSSDAQRDLILDDIKRFDSLGPYEKKKYHELNHTNPNVGIEITRQILSRGRSINDFFEIPESITNSEKFKEQNLIDFEGMYDKKSGKYIKQFKNSKMTEVMKSLHINNANKEIAQFKRQQSFVQNEASQFLKRPDYLKNDFNSSLLQMTENDKIIGLIQMWEFIAPHQCWASSRFELAYLFMWEEMANLEFVYMPKIPIMMLIPLGQMGLIYWFNGYPCLSGIGNKMNFFAWLSEKLSPDMQQAVVTFRTKFTMVRRLRFHSIIFLTQPDTIKIEVTEDDEHWTTVLQEYKTQDLLTIGGWIYFSFHTYPINTYARGVKIIMKGQKPNFYQNRHGIMELSFFSQSQVVQIMEKKSEDWPKCLARAETGYFQIEKPFLLMNCLDVALQNDSREIFYLDNLFIRQWIDKMCLAGSPITASQQNNFVTSQSCLQTDHFKFEIDKSGKIQSRDNPSKCWGAIHDDSVKQVQRYGYVKVSGSLSDSRVNAYDVIDPNSNGFWAPPQLAKNATWALHFDRKYLVEEITIKLKYKPKRISVNILSEDNQWITYLEQDDCKDEIIMVMTPMHMLGIQINFLEKELDQEDYFTPIMGLQKVIMKRPGTVLSLQSCLYQGQNAKIMNRFKFEEVDFIDTSFMIPYRTARSFMINLYMIAKKNIEEFIVKIPYFYLIDKNAQMFKGLIRMSDDRIDDIYARLGKYKKNQMHVIMRSTKSVCLGCSEQTPSSGCNSVLRKNKLRKNGFFWVKTKCMKKAMRVFCDFKTGNGNFYVFRGFLKDESKTVDADSIEKIQNICKKQGLESVEITSEKQIQSIINFLNHMEANSHDEISIPFAYKFDQKFLGEKYLSLNGKQDITNYLKNYMVPQNMMDKLNTIGANLISLKSSHSKLTKTFIEQEKIRGVVCSQNLDLKQTTRMEISCSMIGSELQQGVILKAMCPYGCGSVGRVYGSGVYHTDSNICRTAIHAGMITDLEGGEVELKVVNGLEEYKAEVKNGVKSEGNSGSKNGFQIVDVDRCIRPSSFLTLEEIQHKVKTQKSKQTYLQFKVNADLGGVNELEPGSGEEKDNVKAKAFIAGQLRKKYDFYKKYMSFIKDSQKLLYEHTQILLQYDNTQNSPAFQLSQLNILKEKSETTKDALQGETHRYETMVVKMRQLIHDYNKDLVYLRRFENHYEENKMPFEDVYEAIDGAKVIDGPSKWSFTTQDVFPHDNAITQQSQISCKYSSAECTATMSILRFKKFYDFTLEADFKVMKLGSVGFIFRFSDQFNYYAFVIQETTVQLKRMMDGKQTVMQSQSIDKIVTDQWFNVQITAQQNQFNIKIGKEKLAVDSEKYKSLKIVLKDQDSYFKSGQTGILSDGATALYVDNFAVNHLKCTVPQEKEEEIAKYKQPECSRFREVYMADINRVWVQNEKESVRWAYVQNSFGRKKALKKELQSDQKSKAPIILLNKSLRIGTIQFDIYLKQKTTEFLFVFYYINDHDYYAFMISKKKIAIIQIANGNKQTIKKQEREDIKTDQWYTIYFSISDYQIEIEFEESLLKDRIRLPLFQSERPQLSADKLGFSVDKGTVAIDNILLYPGKAPPAGNILKPPTPASKVSEPILSNDSQGVSKKFKNALFFNQEENVDDDKDNQSSTNKKPDQNSIITNALDQIFNNEYNYKQCLNTTTSTRNNYCENKSHGLAGPKAECKHNFCKQCCTTQVNKKNIQEKCIEDCQYTQPEKDKIYTQCYDTSKPQKSIYGMCNMLFNDYFDEDQKKKCKVDFCDLCCTTASIQYDKDLAKESINDCYQQCSNKFDL